MTRQKDMEVFQDLVLKGNDHQRALLRKVLISYTSTPWRHAATKEEEMSAFLGGDDVMLFERAADKDGLIAAAGLVLWSRPDGYEVTNIVPLELNQLTFSQYNAVLDDFVRQIATPASQQLGFEIETTKARQKIEDWLQPDTLDALRRFSTLANESTGSSHPADRKRWFAFLIKVHKENSDFDADKLVRWLIEVEEWKADKAHNLAIEYEFALDLLIEYDDWRSQ